MGVGGCPHCMLAERGLEKRPLRFSPYALTSGPEFWLKNPTHSTLMNFRCNYTCNLMCMRLILFQEEGGKVILSTVLKLCSNGVFCPGKPFEAA